MSKFVAPVLITSDRDLQELIIESFGNSLHFCTKIPCNNCNRSFAGVEKIITNIKEQQFAHADSVVGNVENHNAQCTQYRKTNRDHSICLCNAKARNNLRLEQREINKGVLNVQA